MSEPGAQLSPAQAARLAQLSLGQATTAVDIERVSIDILLRRWCVEQANLYCEHNRTTAEVKTMADIPVVMVAEAIHRFVTEPLKNDSA